MTPFIVQIFKAYDSPIAPDQTAVIFSFVNNLGTLAFLILIRFTGKRPLFLTMLGGVILSATIICIYGFVVLPSGYNSFDHAKYFSLENHKQLTYIPFICIFLWVFCSASVLSMGWQLVSEIFPYKYVRKIQKLFQKRSKMQFIFSLQNTWNRHRNSIGLKLCHQFCCH